MDPYVPIRDTQRAIQPPDGDKYKILDFEFPDLVTDDRGMFFSHDLKDRATKDRSELLELGVLSPVIQA